MKDYKKKKNRWRWGLYALLSPFVLFFILGILVYLPPVQQFVVEKVAGGLTESVGVKVSVERVRLAFPLDLAVHGVVAQEEGDTLADLRVMRLSVRMCPLFKGIVDVDGLDIYDLKLNTKSWIPDVSLRGEIGKLNAATHGVNLEEETVRLDYATLDRANLFIALSDTGIVDTTTSAPVKWKIRAEQVDLKRSHFSLSMPGDSMRLAFLAGAVHLSDGNLDLGLGEYAVRKIKLFDGGLSYLVRSSWQEGTKGNQAFASADSLAWEGFAPVEEALDFNYLDLRDLNLELSDLSYGQNGKVKGRLDNFYVKERSGAEISELHGSIVWENGELLAEDWVLRTPNSNFDLNFEGQAKSLIRKTNAAARFSLKGTVGSTDVNLLGRGMLDDALLAAWPQSPVQLEITAEGDSNSVRVDTLVVDWPQILRVNMNGNMLYPMRDSRRGSAMFGMQLHNLSFVKRLLAATVDTALAIPRDLALQGRALVDGSDFSLKLNSTVGPGVLHLDGKYNINTERYKVDLSSTAFPLDKFLHGSGIGPLSAKVFAEGRGFDFFHSSTSLKADVSLDTLMLDKWQLGQVNLNAQLADGVGTVNFESANDILDGSGVLEALLGENVTLKLHSDFPDVNLKNIMALKQELSLGATFSLDAYFNRDMTAYGIGGGLTNLRFITEEKGIPARDFFFNFDTSSDTTYASTHAGDLNLRLAARGNIDRMLQNIESFVATLEKQAETKILDQKALKQAAPVLDFSIEAGEMNPMCNLLREMGYTFHKMKMDLSMSPQRGALGNFSMSSFAHNQLLLDTMTMRLYQDTTGLVAHGWIKNFTKKNKTKFEGNLKTYLLDTGGGVEIHLKNEDGVTGMDFGLLADMNAEGVGLHIYPEHPVIAFRNFTVNRDNFLQLRKDSTLAADIDLLADDGTGLRVYSQNKDSVNDITFSLNQLNLADLSYVMPYLPKLGGCLSGDLHMTRENTKISAVAAMEAKDMVFEGAPLGNIGLEAIYLPQNGSEHHANIFVSSEGNEVLSLGGIYRSTVGSEGFEGRAELLDFPLELLNGFLVGTDLTMAGGASGNLMVNGDMSAPVLNGELVFDQAHLRSDVYGFDFMMDNQPVRMVDNQLVLKNFGLYSKDSSNPLLMNGSLDMRNLSKIKLDFGMEAKNFELINAKKTSNSLVFGKVYTDFWGTLKGGMDNLRIRGKLSILDRTDMTYILKDSPLTVDDRLHDLVQFVNFEDSVAEADIVVEPAVNFDMKLGISISDAALFHCNLSEDGANYVDLEGGGDLTLRLTQQGDMRLTGRFTANSGKMKYSLPVIPLKTFNLVQGSYVDFTGAVDNPTLNIAAKERIKAVVTENDQPRSVAFDVGVSITQPLDRMGLEFTIEAPEDLAVQNQLAAMTKAQRGKTAVGMLATGLYLTDESMSSGATGFKASNALTAFLQSEIQNIAGNALKTIDLTIGMENNTSVTGATTTDYSFQFSKRFWGNRVSVIIGGKVSTGAEAENSAESFIDNIAIEYRLDKTASRYVRLFYERSFQDPLEGQLTKTGAGLVLRRKSDRLGELFIFRNKDAKKNKKK